MNRVFKSNTYGRMSFHLWMPDIFGFRGGIQTYSAFLWKALQELYPKAEYDVFLKHDTRALHEAKGLDVVRHDTRYHYSGIWPLAVRTLVFASHLLGVGLSRPPDLVIATHINFARAAHFLKRIAGIPYWVVAHGIEAWTIQDPRLQAALHNADRIFAVSTYTQQRLAQELNLLPIGITLLPNTFDEERFIIASKPAYLVERYGLQRNQPVILTVARLSGPERYKGYDRILYALPKIREKIPSVRYILAGKGSDRQRIERIIAELALQDTVTLAGFIPDEELCDHYNLCDLFVMPSKGEGFGIVYLEALACGKPVVGGNQDGTVDALCNGELGVLINPDSIEEITDAIIKILHGTYEHPLIYCPEELRRKVIQAYGFQKFKQTLLEQLQTHFQ